MARDDVKKLLRRLHEAQYEATVRILEAPAGEELDHVTPDHGSVEETLRTWCWHFWTHHRDLVRARGMLSEDLEPRRMSHFLRQAYAEFARLSGELATMSDDELDLRPEAGPTVRQIVEHVIDDLDHHIPLNIERARRGAAPADRASIPSSSGRSRTRDP